ncbi:MAG TPA: kelch repeat-containing protein [Candidatus Dormibacteraeota bacterium]|nr:kelch repeat-containing protein [Candidatus Dormibacteraeota bacterium]
MKIPLSLAISISAICFLSACGGGSGNSGGGGGTGGATHFAVTAPGAATAGTPFTIAVVALNSSNRTVTGYSGTGHFTSSDAQAVLPPDSTLANGMENISVTLQSPGSSTIVATDIATPTITGTSTAIQVAMNPNLHGFQATATMGGERASHTATLLPNGKVLVAGGTDSLGNDLATVELFDPATGTFTATGSMISSRISFTATLLAHGPAATNGKVLVVGGTAGNTAELFDPSTGTFTATGTPVSARFEGTATLLASGKVLLAGGHGGTAELFDPAMGTFTATGPMKSARDECTATLLNDGTVLITGGESELNSIITAELFDPTTGTFTATGSMTEARSGHSATLLNNGKVLVTGGINSNDDVSTTAELFDPASGTFSTVSPMTSGHAFHTATLLDDGTVLVAGGFPLPNSSGNGSVIAELFDPATHLFARTGSLGTGRYLHTATKLNNGEVLVTGGEFKTTPAMILKSAELYK